jgi:phosphoribosylformylglycinamidine cyclo-ligase
MNVNDILCAGATPLFFLDYIATGNIRTRVLKSIIASIAKGCRQSGCSLVGGEVAEMPGIYKSGEYDIAGFCVGISEKNNIPDSRYVKKGDLILGLESNGLHSNGFSMVRKVYGLSEQKKRADELLRPTRIYVKPVLKLFSKAGKNPVRNIKAIAHVTGGAFYKKVPRMAPRGMGIRIYKNSWPILPVFGDIMRAGGISEKEMYGTFNMGIGMTLVLKKSFIKDAMALLKTAGVKSWVIGEISGEKQKVVIE